MAPKVTSSRNRSTRKASKPPTTGQNPGRANRQSISQAKVTASGGGTPGSAKVTTGGGGTKPPSKPVGTGGGGLSKPNGRQPRAITNGNNPAIRQLRAKAIQAQRQAQGKSTVASRNPGITPESAKGQRISQMAKAQRVIGDSGQVRAAQARGQAEVAKAQARRGARAAMKNMEGTLKAARTARQVAGAVRGLSYVEAAKAGLQAYNTGDATLKAALKRGDYKPKQGPASKTTTTGSFNKKSFNEAFRTARSSGAKEFSWRGKRYNTKKKGE